VQQTRNSFLEKRKASARAKLRLVQCPIRSGVELDYSTRGDSDDVGRDILLREATTIQNLHCAAGLNKRKQRQPDPYCLTADDQATKMADVDDELLALVGDDAGPSNGSGAASKSKKDRKGGRRSRKVAADSDMDAAGSDDEDGQVDGSGSDMDEGNSDEEGANAHPFPVQGIYTNEEDRE
jgi:hypothetical protein